MAPLQWLLQGPFDHLNAFVLRDCAGQNQRVLEDVANAPQSVHSTTEQFAAKGLKDIVSKLGNPKKLDLVRPLRVLLNSHGIVVLLGGTHDQHSRR